MHIVSLQPNSMLADVLKENNTAVQNNWNIFDRRQKEN